MRVPLCVLLPLESKTLFGQYVLKHFDERTPLPPRHILNDLALLLQEIVFERLRHRSVQLHEGLHGAPEIVRLQLKDFEQLCERKIHYHRLRIKLDRARVDYHALQEHVILYNLEA